MHAPRPRLRLLVTGGGTGGHVFPIIAVLEELRSRPLDLEVHWIGSSTGLEREAAAEAGIPFHPVAVGKLRRYVSLRNVLDSARVPLGSLQSLALVRRLNPDVVFSTGGYVGVPAVVAAWMLRIPSLTHEQTAMLGLATRINARFSDVIALSNQSTPRPNVRRSARVVVTGNPVRAALLDGDADAARSIFRLKGDRPLLYVTGGAQGAKALNDAVAACLDDLLEMVEIVHQTGPDKFNGSYSALNRQRAGLCTEKQARYHLVERTGNELAHLYAATDLVLSRSGAGTVTELAAIGIPAIFVPLPGAEEQLANARVLANRGGAIIIPQPELTPDRLLAEVRRLCADRAELAAMAERARSDRPLYAARLLADELLALAGISP